MLTAPWPQVPAARTGTPPSYLSALRQLESPVNQDVLNLAATLTTQAEDDADEASLRYLRRVQNHEEWRVERSRDRLRMLERQRDQLDQRDRLRRVMNRLSRNDDAPAAYSDRVPSQNNLYDWSPANDEADEDELDEILTELRREQPNTHPEILRMLGRTQLDSERDTRTRANSSRLLNSNQPSHSTDSSLRSAAILQSVRRHPRFSARTRDMMQRYGSDRDAAPRPSHHSESRDRHVGEGTRPAAATMQRVSERRTSLERDRDREMLARVDSYRRSYAERTSSTPPTSSPMLEETIKYLSRIRYSNSVDDSLGHLLDTGFLSKDFFCDDHSDFVLDSGTLPPPAETSWLAPGAVLSGCQHATSVTSTVTAVRPTSSHRSRLHEAATGSLFEPPARPWLSHNYTSASRRTTHLSPPEIVTSHSPQQDRWPVKVTIHAVDYSKMTLSATMEAYNVPSHPHSHQSLLSSSLDGAASPAYTRTSSITTYLEGQILDFNTHTLLTESWSSDSATDATYWRKLPPFQKYSDDELARNLTSRRWFNEVLAQDWVLMRWKEQCFVKSLNRSTADPVLPPSSTSTSSFSPPESFPSSRENHRPDRSTTHWLSTPTSTTTTTTTTTTNSSATHPDAEHSSFDDSGCGLTISGFYYVCLRRCDGKLEGLYYDPQSSPYQCLKLDSVRGGVFPAWEFR
ncbi:vacuolar import and degradation protein-domain-containing protein [Massariosphaeria phaeospora]|uniref:Vacuolar import and degradation protein-domain-containing protein n=1 Tax=Massariosphaeria phaeospora TaxID=100035 RepID=A0A7C8IBS4_9PLEO|nr:vacuolar import and degradation protein-domain-containing protein [Massariosphaeria phaeospora]